MMMKESKADGSKVSSYTKSGFLSYCRYLLMYVESTVVRSSSRYSIAG